MSALRAAPGIHVSNDWAHVGVVGHHRSRGRRHCAARRRRPHLGHSLRGVHTRDRRQHHAAFEFRQRISDRRYPGRHHHRCNAGPTFPGTEIVKRPGVGSPVADHMTRSWEEDMRKRIILGLAVAMAALMGVAHAEDKKVTIGVSIPAADHGWTAGVVFHAQRMAKLLMAQHPGLNVIVKTSPDPATQANAVQDLVTQGINALVILPSDPDPLVNAIKEVKNKNIFVTLVDRAPSNNDNSVRDLYVAGNNPALGATAGEYIKKNTPNAQVAVIRGLPIPIDQQRQDGFDKAISGSGVKVIQKQFGNWNRDDAFKVMQDYLTKYPKIDVVWCQDDDMAVGVLQAIDQAKRTEIQYVIAGAGSKDMVKKVMDGDKLVPVDVLYPPAMVATAMELTAANFYNQVPVRGSYILDATLITKDNAKGFYFPDSPF